ncbi:hypothetical protein [Streptomyces sp.]|uniref:hypothetical protein n=1 Tax=Streptomyces sp. TaxID=1931 RepID=UPI002F925791
MSSSAERAAQLRAEADALEAQAVLETALLDAKASGDRASIREAAEALRAARSETRTEGFTVGGDAFVANPGEEV